MRYILLCFSLSASLQLLTISFSYSQPWQFVKEKEGIRLYLRQEANSAFKSFHGETEFRGNFEKVCSLVGDPTKQDWWGDDVKDIRVLAYEKDKLIRYYFIYDAPWPLTNRDLVAEVHISDDPATGAKVVASKQLLNVVPLNPDMVRVTNFHQKWTILPMKNGIVQVTLEGFINPGGEVPSWLYNMIIVDIPLRLLKVIRERGGVK
ncbi:MAG: hypothetical protein HXX13_01440 [Bacteroidetes bacterium]|nr:hypothetical protein [Bacteroidota bacterium]